MKRLKLACQKVLAVFDPDHTAYRSQAGQDQFVLKHIYKKKKRNGFFLEMGAADGILLSNTFVFEKRYGWKGILVEPSHRYESLVKNRSARCVRACICEKGASMFLLELPGARYLDKDDNNTLRSVSIAADSRDHAMSLVPGILEKEGFSSEQCGQFQLVEVPGLTLTQLLDECNAPKIIDYFSLDVEGYEDAVFGGFDFTKYRFNVMNIERPSDALRLTLEANGYKEVLRNGIGDIFYLHQAFEAP